ncbi:MAG: bifunctional phosphopantothenoylcysteine decarboxylase/phosphopantothenate--cysteine ligase CoaBC [Ilumatobacteraceae bacterium]
MSALTGKHIVIGVSGGIAAYKSVELCRLLVDAGAHVAPIMTSDAEHFIGKATLSALASEPVHTSLWDDTDPIPHTRLGQLADLVVVVPATARVIGAFAAGISSDLLIATLLATRAPVMLCPAMHTEMWEHQAVQENLATLRRRGVHVMDPESGRLAGGDVGIGRLADPHFIFDRIVQLLTPGDLYGTHIVVTAGGTREPIDAVRVIANRSSGKQGYAIAAEAAARGAKVTLISTMERNVLYGVDTVLVETAVQMQEALSRVATAADVIIMAAAVADVRPKHPSAAKLKKDPKTGIIARLETLELEPTPDILAGLGATKKPGQVLVGFAAETDNLIEHGCAKLVSKNLDLIVANNVADPGVGFGHNTNAVTLIFKDGPSREVPLADKRVIAREVLDSVVRIRTGHLEEPA